MQVFIFLRTPILTSNNSFNFSGPLTILLYKLKKAADTWLWSPCPWVYNWLRRSRFTFFRFTLCFFFVQCLAWGAVTPCVRSAWTVTTVTTQNFHSAVKLSWSSYKNTNGNDLYKFLLGSFHSFLYEIIDQNYNSTGNLSWYSCKIMVRTIRNFIYVRFKWTVTTQNLHSAVKLYHHSWKHTMVWCS